MNKPTLLLGFLFGAVASASALASQWQVDYSASTLAFAALQEGKVIQGQFQKFDANIWFDPDQLANSRFQVHIDMKSVDTGSTERDEILRSGDFFAVSSWPNAHFKTLTIERKQGIKHEASALLKIRNIERLVNFPFDLKVASQQNAKVLSGEGQLEIDRFDFDMAHGDWRDTSVVGAKVDIHIRIRAVLNQQLSQESSTTPLESSTTQQESSTTQQEPSTTQQESSTTQQEPSTTQQEPSTTQQEPSTTQQEPSTTQQEPSKTQREPSTAQQESSTPSQESSK